MMMNLNSTSNNICSTQITDNEPCNIQQQAIKNEEHTGVLLYNQKHMNKVFDRIEELKPILKELNREMDMLQKIVKDKFGSLTEMTIIGNFYLIPTVVKRKGYEVPDQEYTTIKIKHI
jgi:hypothetical protein